ncbi:nuclear transport factor 2 family protein [Okeanomitos corallinicola TIOX110]|uniref:Nuclear transport factor 2 family protein n=1 Tax=Okeanomitos corallinicola TIOX110 TaxID=3133117 RepID=A0ABZ2UUV9_9CYAN
MINQKWKSIYKFTQILLSVLLVFVIWNVPQNALAADVSPEDLKSIIRTRDIALESLNTRDFTKVQPYLHPDFTITTVDNQVFHKVPEFETYWNQQFSNTIEDIKMKFKGDTLRTFLTPEIDVATGEAITTFSFKDGKSADMGVRWTAVLQKLPDKWVIQSLHFSSNLLDNPVLKAAQQVGKMIAIGAGIAGFMLGTLIMLLLRRRTRPRSQRT